MGAIPRSDLPGHRTLHERGTAALDRCQEAEDIDFKESGDWESLKWRITHSALGMSNLRDGGLVIVGVAERDGRWSLTGVSKEHLATYDPDIVSAHINAYASPQIDLDLVVIAHGEGLEYLAFYFREFRDTPIVCKKNGPTGSGIVEARVYVRLSGPARTSIVTNAIQLHDLLELAAEKRARRLLETARRVGLGPTSAPSDRFDQELGGL